MPYDKNGKYYRKPVYKIEKIKKDLPQKKNLFRRGCLFGCLGFAASLLIGFLMSVGFLYNEIIEPYYEWANRKPEPRVDLPLCRKNQDPYRTSLFPLRLGIFRSCRGGGVNDYDWEYEKRKLEKMEKINKKKLKKMKKPVKKDASMGSVKINCDSPVWKNKPKCN